MTHDELIPRAEKWLLKTKLCKFCLTEYLTHYSNESPDAIGWKYGNQSYLIECKATRADFKSDHKKRFRKNSKLGMGVYRYYMVPTNLVFPSEIPDRWGLLYVSKKKVRCVVKAQPFKGRNLANELSLMCSALRRIYLRGDLPKIYEPLIRK